MKKILLVVLLMFVSFSAQADMRTIAITGEGSLELEADMIEISFSIKNLNKSDLKLAKKEVDEITQNAIRALVDLGINEKDIYSPKIIIDHEEGYDKDDCPQDYIPIVFRQMGVKLIDIQLYTKVIDTLLESGVTGIDDVESMRSDYEKQKKAAILMAIKDAKEQAKFYVENFDSTLGKVRSIGRKSVNQEYGYDNEKLVVIGTRSRRKVTEPYTFRPAAIEVNASVHVVFDIN